MFTPAARAWEGNDGIDWLTIADRHESVVADVRRLRNHPLVPGEIPICGMIFTRAALSTCGRAKSKFLCAAFGL